MSNPLPHNLIIGVDPGLRGGFARLRWLSGEGVWVPEVEVAQTKIMGNDHREMDVSWMKKVIKRRPLARKMAFVEEYTPYKKKGRGLGALAISKAAKNQAWWMALFSAYEIPYMVVAASKWKKAMGVTADKQTSIDECQRLWPDISLLATPSSRTPHDGMAEALLIASYGCTRMRDFCGKN